MFNLSVLLQSFIGSLKAFKFSFNTLKLKTLIIQRTLFVMSIFMLTTILSDYCSTAKDQFWKPKITTHKGRKNFGSLEL
jgi:hypothetical protein